MQLKLEKISKNKNSKENKTTTYLSGSPFKASSSTSGVLSVPCGNFFANSSTYFSSGNRSSSESTWNNRKTNSVYAWKSIFETAKNSIEYWRYDIVLGMSVFAGETNISNHYLDLKLAIQIFCLFTNCNYQCTRHRI